MKKLIAYIVFVAFNIFVLLSCSEHNEESVVPASVVINGVSDITYKSATINIKIAKGTENIKLTGVKYVMESQTDTINAVYNTFSEENQFEIEGLKYNSKYIVYAYAQTDKGNIYKSTISTFSTQNGEIPSVSSVILLERNTTSVKLSSEVVSNQDFPIIEKGYYVSGNSDMSNSERKVVEDMNVVLTDLQPRKAYYVCAYAKNEIGESKSSTFLFETKSLNGQWSYAFSTTARCMAVAASDGKELFFGLGCRGEKKFYDWNKYDPQTKTITQLADFPGLVANGLNDNNAFFIENSVFVTCADNTFWAYDTKSNIWEEKRKTTGERYHHVALASNGKGYYGLGEFYRTDLWEYNHQNDNWVNVTSSPFSWFSRNAVFAVGDNIFFLSRQYDYNRDFHKYNTKTKQWSKVKDFPGIGNQDTFGFTIGSRGYVVVGTYNVNGSSAYTSELWEYTPLYDEWEQKADYLHNVIGVAGCGVGEKAYIGCGFTFSTSGYPLSDFYLFDPDK